MTLSICLGTSIIKMGNPHGLSDFAIEIRFGRLSFQKVKTKPMS
jgi:hypothetical protein